MALYLEGRVTVDAKNLPPKEATAMSRDIKYIGMDVHKEAIVIAVLNASGKLVMESIVETQASSILQFMHGLQGELHLTWEEGTWAAWLYDLLQPHGLEACAGAHFVGTALREQGHEVRLIPAQFVKPYRKSSKNDFLDAEAIAEAVTKQNMRFAQLKTQEQLDWQAMHRVRDRLVRRRTALINEIRGFLLERGITFAAQPIHLRKNLPTVIEDAEQNLSPRLRWLLDCMWQEWKQIETDVEAITDEIERISNEDARCRAAPAHPRLRPAGLHRHCGRHRQRLCLWSRTRLRGLGGRGAPTVLHRGQAEAVRIGKRGNVYLRRMLIHGARSVLFRVKYDTGGFGQWVHRLAQRAPHNKVIVAIANKLARIAWAVLSSGQDYRHQPLPQRAAA
jgi:transposase